jgi:hypothetical protein
MIARGRSVAALRFRRTIALGMQLPFAIVVTTVITVVGALSGTIWRDQHAAIMRTVGVDLSTLRDFRLHQLALATFYQSKPGIDWRMVVAIALIVGALENVVGTVRSAVTFVLTDVVTSVFTVLALTAMGALGWNYAYTAARTPDSGSSVAMLACAGALAMVLPGWKRTVGLTVLGAYVLPALLWWSFATWLGHLIGACIGIAVGAHFHATSSPVQVPPP